MPNLFAYAMIYLWPILAIYLYKKYDIVTATFWVVVGGYMFLPLKAGFDLPLIPAIGKNEISALSALLGCYYIAKQKIYFLGVTQAQKGLIGILLIVPILNVFFNQEIMFNGAKWIQGLTLYDAFSQIVAQYLQLLPFIISVSIIRNLEDVQKVIKLLVYAGLIYSFVVLFEVRFSPQLHSWIYGFFPHSFAQQVRFGGFRSVGFMGHGLLVATFYFVCVSAAAIQITLSDNKDKIKNIAIFIYLFFVLLLSKSVGSIFLTILSVTCILYCSYPIRKFVIIFLVSIFFLYPTLSILNLIPYESIIAFISDFNADKAQSLEFRFVNEHELMQHANEKLFTGWGSWARNRLDGTITDGYWIIVYGQYGLFFFYALFGLFINSLFNKEVKNVAKSVKSLHFSWVLIVAGVLFDQIPNASLGGSWLWFLSGIMASPYVFSHYDKSK